MPNHENHFNLPAIARETLLRFGFLVEPPRTALTELATIHAPDFSRAGLKDLTAWLWSSIDNDDSRDLDQIEYLRQEAGGTRLFVGIADVASLVQSGGALDQAARHNTTSIYTGVRTYPMLPEKLSTDLTSLVEGEPRLAVVVEMFITPDGSIAEQAAYRAVVQNHSQLTYRAVAAWLEGQPGEASPASALTLSKIGESRELQQQLRQQHELAETLRRKRLEAGALTFETIELRPEVKHDGGWELQAATHNVATWLIEDFMIAANQAAVRILQARGFPSLRRVVRTPKNWPQIVRLAGEHGFRLPVEPEAKPLEDFLMRQRQQDPDRFPDLSLAIIKLLGRGEYTVAAPGGEAPGHFALAIEGYTHSTAPNRRYPDVITQRLLQASLENRKLPYSLGELADLAQHCTEKENDANKAERSVHKSIAAAALANRVGEKFEGMITGAADKGTWVRILHPPVEGRVGGAVQGLHVGDRVTVKLASTDPWRGYIDFDLIGRR